jgi:hypothetical protein
MFSSKAHSIENHRLIIGVFAAILIVGLSVAVALSQRSGDGEGVPGDGGERDENDAHSKPLDQVPNLGAGGPDMEDRVAGEVGRRGSLDPASLHQSGRRWM